MRTNRIGIGMLAAVLAAGVQPSSAQDARAAEVLAKTRAALGRTESVKSLSVEAEMERNLGAAQMSGDVEVLVEMPDKYVKRDEMRGMMNRTLATGFSGDRAITPAGAAIGGGGGTMVFRIGPGGPAQDVPKPTPEQLEEINAVTLRNARAEASRFMLGWLGMAHPALKGDYTYAGEAESPDGKAHVIDVTAADGFEARLFIDQNNYLPLMVTYKGYAPRMMTSGPMRVTQGQAPAAEGGKPLTDEERQKRQQEIEERMRRELADQPLVEFALFFDDWREVDGFTFPHLMRRATAGETTEEWKITRVKVNGRIDAKRFASETKQE